MNIRFARRIGPGAKAIQACTSSLFCPDIFELESGDFAVIGADITEDAKEKLPGDAGCGPHERIVVLPRKVLLAAKPYIP